MARSHLPARFISRAATKPPKNPDAEAIKPKAAPVLNDTEKSILKKVTAYTTKAELIPISTAPIMHAIADLFVKICLKAFKYSGFAKDSSCAVFDGIARKQTSRLTIGNWKDKPQQDRTPSCSRSNNASNWSHNKISKELARNYQTYYPSSFL